MKKIIITRNVKLTDDVLSRLKELAEISVSSDDTDETLMFEIKNADTIIVGPRPYITRKLIEAAPNLKHIARVGVGLDSIDIKAASENDIYVTNTPGVAAVSVAEFTMSMLLSLAKNVHLCDRAVKNGEWDSRIEILQDNIELNGKTHGIVGMGRIGRYVALRCKGFGMNVVYYKRNRDHEFETSRGVKYAHFETLLKESDTISLHLPLTEETLYLFDTEEFSMMKNTALLINQSRGKVVNEDALVEALKNGLIGGYATDVYDNEPPDPNSPLLGFRNVISTPHLGGSTRESRIRSSEMIFDVVSSVFQGKVPKNTVNQEIVKNES